MAYVPSDAVGAVPPADTFTVFLAKFVFTNMTGSPQTTSLPLSYRSGDTPKALRLDDKGLLWLGDNLRGQVLADKPPVAEAESLRKTFEDEGCAVSEPAIPYSFDGYIVGKLESAGAAFTWFFVSRSRALALEAGRGGKLT